MILAYSAIKQHSFKNISQILKVYLGNNSKSNPKSVSIKINPIFIKILYLLMKSTQ